MINSDLNGKTALITGAASGIGFATARMLAVNGCKVALNDLPDNPRLDEAVQTLTDAGCEVIAAPGDAGSEGPAMTMVEKAIADLGRLDFLINNAATPGTKKPIPANDLETADAAFWKRLLEINLLGPLCNLFSWQSRTDQYDSRTRPRFWTSGTSQCNCTGYC